ncbi:MAG: hypothetical protein ABIE36_01815 [Candidatus Diapherotrites archaeon]
MKHPRIFLFSLFALGFLVLAFLVNWMFIIGAVVLIILNQRELMRKFPKDI